MQGLRTEQDGSIVIHIFTDSSETAITAWAESAARVIEATSPDENFLLLLDVSAKQVSFTHFARQKTQELFTRYRQRRGRFALLFSSKIAPYYACIFLTSLGALSFELASFSNREEAIRWLKEADRKN
jgi:hypothetical protein